MQLYRGLPIITNQIQPHEMRGIPHHLLALLSAFATAGAAETWQVGVYRRECLRVIAEIHARGKIPVVVGGTHYYTQAVLVNEPLVDDGRREQQQQHQHQQWDPPSEISSEIAPSANAATAAVTPAEDPRLAILDGPVDAMLEMLREVDPVMAARWHPHEDRKIRRSLEIYLRTGRKASDIYEEHQRMKQKLQQQQDHDQEDPSHSFAADTPEMKQLRFPSLVFWVHSDTQVLKTRLNARVGKMVQQGLMNEAKVLFDYLQEQKEKGLEVDRTRGIWVSIGFKELEPYFEAKRKVAQQQQQQQQQGTTIHDEEALEKLKQKCLEDVRTSTRQYAKQQLKWIRGKLWNALSAASATRQLFVVDSTRPENWQADVLEPATRITPAFLRGEHIPDPKQVSAFANNTLAALVQNRQSLRCDSPMVVQNVRCEACDVLVLSGIQWERHVASGRHKRSVKSSAKREQLMRDNPYYRAAMAATQSTG